jgi:hypothetical protein
VVAQNQGRHGDLPLQRIFPIPKSEFLIGVCPKSSKCRFTFALLLTSSHFFKYNTRGKGKAISLAFILRKKMKREIGLIHIWCIDGFAEGYGR